VQHHVRAGSHSNATSQCCILDVNLYLQSRVDIINCLNFG
jgi:hypothetical protein